MRTVAIAALAWVMGGCAVLGSLPQGPIASDADLECARARQSVPQSGHRFDRPCWAADALAGAATRVELTQ
jgi:hypothetical protein